MKIVFFPGVGFHKNPKRYKDFFIKIQKEVDCEVEYFQWKHSYSDHSHDDSHKYNLPYSGLRSLFSEAILDFQHVLKYSESMKLPEADIYMGHSAGSIIALHQDKPCIVFGSPALLIEDLQFANDELLQRCLCKDRPVLNILNTKDIISYPLDHERVDNFLFKGSLLNPFSYSPISTHKSYWKNKKVIRKVITTLKEWDNS